MPDLATSGTRLRSRTCRCGATITFGYLPGYYTGRWIPAGSTQLGDSWCEDGYLHKPGCPPSEVHDQALPWFEIGEGDLVVYDGKWHRLERMWPAMNPARPAEFGIELLREGETTRHFVDSSDLTAVRRYDTGEG